MTRRIGILGGTFNPVHRGHIDLGLAAQAALALTSVFVIPSSVPPHRPAPVASSFHRFAMVALAVAGRSDWQASDLELCEGTPTYTSTTLRRLHQRGYGAEELFFLVGADAFSEIGIWKDSPAILDSAHFAVVSRPGWPVYRLREALPAFASRMRTLDDWSEQPGTMIILIDAQTTDVSATAVRRRREEGLPVDDLVPPAVGQHIEQHGLYASTSSDRRGPGVLTNPAAGRLHGQS